MFGRRPDFGKVFLDSSGRKLLQAFINFQDNSRSFKRDESEFLSKICAPSQGILYKYPDYSAKRFDKLNVEDQSKRAVQIILHSWLLSKNPRQRGELSVTWAGIENGLAPFISPIQEGYRNAAAKSIADEFKHFANAAFKSTRPGCLPAFRVPLQGQLDFRAVVDSVAENGTVLSVNISCVRQQNFSEKMLSCP